MITEYELLANDLGMEGAREVCELLKTNSTLTSLNVGWMEKCINNKNG